MSHAHSPPFLKNFIRTSKCLVVFLMHVSIFQLVQNILPTSAGFLEALFNRINRYTYKFVYFGLRATTEAGNHATTTTAAAAIVLGSNEMSLQIACFANGELLASRSHVFTLSSALYSLYLFLSQCIKQRIEIVCMNLCRDWAKKPFYRVQLFAKVHLLCI